MSSASDREPPDEGTVAAYLANRLDPSSAEAFEAYCLQHAEFARQVELDGFLKVGFRQMQQSYGPHWLGLRRRTVLALAAGLILAVGCGLLLVSSLRTGTMVAYQSLAQVPSGLLSGPRVAVTLIRLREGSGVRRLIAPRGAGLLAARIAPDSPPGQRGYSIGVALEPADSPRSVTLDGLRTDGDGYLDLYLPLAALVGRTLTISVNPSPASGTEMNSFRLQVAAAQSTPATAP